jgi:hypothetical protein
MTESGSVGELHPAKQKASCTHERFASLGLLCSLC